MLSTPPRRPSRRARRGPGTRSAVSALAAGIAVVAVYVLAALTTLGSHQPVRPLFEGVGPPPAYQWVKPPARFAPGNVKPTAVEFTVPFVGGASTASSLTTPDQQFLASIPAGGIAPRAGDTSVLVTITPLDPATLGPTPAGLAPDGNAYHLEMVYKPSGEPVPGLTAGTGVVLAAPSVAQALLYAPDGRTWQQQPVEHTTGAFTATGTWQRPGYFLAAGAPETTPVGGTDTGSNTGQIVLVVAITVTLAAVLGLAPVAVRRRRAARSAGSAAPAPARAPRAGRPPPARGAKGPPPKNRTRRRKGR